MYLIQEAAVHAQVQTGGGGHDQLLLWYFSMAVIRSPTLAQCL